jgi:hypothetical protein
MGFNSIRDRSESKSESEYKSSYNLNMADKICFASMLNSLIKNENETISFDKFFSNLDEDQQDKCLDDLISKCKNNFIAIFSAQEEVGFNLLDVIVCHQKKLQQLGRDLSLSDQVLYIKNSSKRLFLILNKICRDIGIEKSNVVSTIEATIENLDPNNGQYSKAIFLNDLKTLFSQSIHDFKVSNLPVSLDKWMDDCDIVSKNNIIAIGDYSLVDFKPSENQEDRLILSYLRHFLENKDVAVWHIPVFDKNNNNLVYVLIALLKIIKIIKSGNFPNKDNIKYLGGVTNTKFAMFLKRLIESAGLELEFIKTKNILAAHSLSVSQDNKIGLQISLDSLIRSESNLCKIAEKLLYRYGSSTPRFYGDNRLMSELAY